MAKTSFGSDKPTAFGGTAQQGQGALAGHARFSGLSGSGLARRTSAPQTHKFRKEYGYRMTDEQASAMKQAETDFENRIKKYRNTVNSQIHEANKKIQKAKGDLSKFDSGVVQKVKGSRQKMNKAWQEFNKAKKGVSSSRAMFDYMMKQGKKVPVRIVSGDKIEAVHHLPREMVERMLQDKNLNASWVDNGKNVNVEVRQGGRIRGKEIHEAFNRDNMYKQFIADPEFNKTQKKFKEQIDRGYRDLMKSEREVAKAEGLVSQARGDARSKISWGEFEVKEGAKTRDREIAGARGVAAKQKANQAKNYRKWRKTRQQAYAQLAKIGLKTPEKK